MRPRLKQKDLLTIAHYLGSVVVFVAVTMLAPIIVGVIYGEWRDVFIIAFGLGMTLVCGMALRFCRVRPGELGTRNAIIVTGLAWALGSLLFAFPLFMMGHYRTFLDAFFEAVSGFTTSGLTMVVNIDHMSNAANSLRFLTQIIGGPGIMLAAVALGMFSRQGAGVNAATSIYRSESRTDRVLPNIRHASRAIWRYVATGTLTGAVFIGAALLLAGMPLGSSILHGLWLSISAFNTGGFAPHATSLIYYHSPLVELAVSVVGVLGIINFAVYGALARCRSGELLKNIEIRTLLLWSVSIVVIMVLTLTAGTSGTELGAVLRRGLFTAISAISNTGFSNSYVSQLTNVITSGALLTFVIAMAVGGSMCSTSGGIKLMRVGIMARSLLRNIRDGLSPDSAMSSQSYHHLGKRPITPELTAEAFTVTLFYLVTYVAGAAVGVLCGYEALPAMLESVSATSNTGLSAGVTAVGMPVVLEVTYIIQMLAGRLEFVTLFAVIYIFVASLLPPKKVSRRYFDLRSETRKMIRNAESKKGMTPFKEAERRLRGVIRRGERAMEDRDREGRS